MKHFLFLCLFFLASPAIAEDLSLCVEGWKKTEMGEHAEAISLLQECVDKGDLTERSLSRTYRNLGIVYKRIGQFEEALKQLGLALSHQAEDPWNDYVNRGTVWVKLNDFKKAFNDYNQALSIKPDYGPAYYGRGELFEVQGKTQQAIIEYQKAYDSGWKTKLLYDKFVKHGLVEPQSPSN